MFCVKILRWLDLNCGPPVSQATALAAELQPLPESMALVLKLQHWKKKALDQLLKQKKQCELIIQSKKGKLMLKGGRKPSNYWPK